MHPRILIFIATSEITLTSSPHPSSNGYFCPRPVQYTCVGTEINGLTWRINSINRVSYNPIDNTEQNIPLNLAPPLPNANVNIFNATRISDNSIDVVSTLNLLDVSDFRESVLIECFSSDITCKEYHFSHSR